MKHKLLFILFAFALSGCIKVNSPTTTTTTEKTRIAAFNYTVDHFTVYFDNTSTSDLISFEWDFGDGGTSTEKNPVYMYYVAQKYKVVLSAWNKAGQKSTCTGYIDVVGNY